MKLSLNALDDEIREVENRIALERVALEDAISGCTDGVRNALTSPPALLALAGAGFVVGKLMFGRKAAATPTVTAKAGVLGLLTGAAGTAVSLMRPGSGLGTLVRWGVEKAVAKRQARKARAAATQEREAGGTAA